jgi:hypothetical protein
MRFKFIFGVDLALLMVYLLSFDLDFSPCCLFRGLFLGLQGVFRIHNIGTQDALSSSHPDERH